jgi:hypothetical protein
MQGVRSAAIGPPWHAANSKPCHTSKRNHLNAGHTSYPSHVSNVASLTAKQPVCKKIHSNTFHGYQTTQSNTPILLCTHFMQHHEQAQDRIRAAPSSVRTAKPWSTSVVLTSHWQHPGLAQCSQATGSTHACTNTEPASPKCRADHRWATGMRQGDCTPCPDYRIQGHARNAHFSSQLCSGLLRASCTSKLVQDNKNRDSAKTRAAKALASPIANALKGFTPQAHPEVDWTDLP